MSFTHYESPPPLPPNPGSQFGPGTVSSPPPPPPPPKSDGALSPQQAHPSSTHTPQRQLRERHPTQESFSPTSQQQFGGPVVPQQHGGSSQSTVGQSSDNQWLPDMLRDKSKADLETILNDPALLASLLNAPSTAPPSLHSSQKPLQEQLNSNLQLATQLLSLESQIQNLRSSLTPSLLRVSALERQFRAKQETMDDALAPWAPKAVHTRLGQGVQEQEAFCQALEESFLEATDSTSNGPATDREISEWLKKYRENRKVLELRKEKKLRLEEGRVGGWK